MTTTNKDADVGPKGDRNRVHETIFFFFLVLIFFRAFFAVESNGAS